MFQAGCILRLAGTSEAFCGGQDSMVVQNMTLQQHCLGWSMPLCGKRAVRPLCASVSSVTKWG